MAKHCVPPDVMYLEAHTTSYEVFLYTLLRFYLTKRRLFVY